MMPNTENPNPKATKKNKMKLLFSIDPVNDTQFTKHIHTHSHAEVDSQSHGYKSGDTT